MRIGELAAATGVPTKTLRYWEDMGLLPAPSRTGAGYRDYGPQAADRVAFVRNAQASGLTLRQIRQVLAIRDNGAAPCTHVAALIDERLDHVEARLAELEQTRAALHRLRGRLAALDPVDCDPSRVCSAVEPEPSAHGRSRRAGG